MFVDKLEAPGKEVSKIDGFLLKSSKEKAGYENQISFKRRIYHSTSKLLLITTN